MSARLFLSNVLVLVVGSSCDASLPEPASAVHPETDYVVVPYPPPAALAELVPPAPSPRARWVDGHWEWREGRYEWERGGWFEPAAERLARWSTRYLTNGTLLYAPSRWLDARGRAVAEPPKLAPATTPPNEVTPESEAAR